MIFKRKIKDKKGQSLVETAIVLPILALLLTVIFSVGQLVNAQIVCNTAAYEGARKAVVIADPSQALATAQEIAVNHVKHNGIGLYNIKVTPKISDNGVWTKGNNLTYTVSANVDLLLGLLRHNKPITGEITIMIERE